MTATAIFYHPLFLEHDTGEYHPESAQRLVAARRALLASGLELLWVTPEAAAVDQVARVHSRAYIDQVRQIAERGGGSLDWDTSISPDSYAAALLAAGAGIEAVTGTLSTGRRAFLLVRPPGHHATGPRGMGFCLFNNVAVATAYARAELGVERVMIVDWDVHHGNGTQDIFYDDPHVLYLSFHEKNHYPGTGAVGETGGEGARGFTVNTPLSAGAGNGAARLFFTLLVEPLARAWRPELLLVSSGFDSESGDPLGDLELSGTAYQWMASRLVVLAEELGAGGPVCFLEGGYDPARVAHSIVLTVRGLQDEPVEFEPDASAAEERDVAATLKALTPYWKGVLSP
jgi:acetoin utilization deacetylase AcuC-like enzyme